MSNNTLDATEFFRIPASRVVELGGQIEIWARKREVGAATLTFANWLSCSSPD